jgi:hypothetical protein
MTPASYGYPDLIRNDLLQITRIPSKIPHFIGGRLAELPILLATGYAERPPGSDLDLPRIGKPSNSPK